MNEEKERSLSAEGSDKPKSSKHRYNKHRRGGHHKNKPHGDAVRDGGAQKPPQNEMTSAEAETAKRSNNKRDGQQQRNDDRKKPHNDNRGRPGDQRSLPREDKAAPTDQRNAAKEEQNRSVDQKDRDRSKNRPQKNRGDLAPKQTFTPPTVTLLDSAPEDDLIFGKQSSFTKKVQHPTFTAEELNEVREFTDEELFGTSHMCTAPINGEDTVEVVSVRFKKTGKSYFFDPKGHKFSVGSFAVLDTARGPEFGEISEANRSVPAGNVIQPLRPVLRPATKDDIAKNAANKAKEAEAFGICLKKIAEHKLDMKLVDAQYVFDNSKLLFYFTSAGRVDFRELVRDLAAVFKTRIELRQIGIRDEAKMLGGIGICGRPLCCSRFLSNFAQVSIKMAKEQGLSLNSGKISGNCGRLMCCLNFENQTYLNEIKLTPMPGSVVTVDGQTGTVTEATPLIGMLKVHLHSAPDGENITVHRDSVTVLEKKAIENDERADSAE